MKKFVFFSALLVVSLFVKAQTSAVTATGQRIILFPNGTWINADSSYNFSFGAAFTIDIKNEFTDAYNFAFKELYADVFFESDRKQKAADWAANSIRSGLTVYAGRKSLSSWYDDLYFIAYNYVYGTVFFDSERIKQANEWAKKILETKTIFDPVYYPTYFKKYREAYQLAYNSIYKNEFFASDRQTKARNWTNTFMTGK